MRVLVVVLTALVAMVAVPSGAAVPSNPLANPFQNAEPVTTPIYDHARPLCAQILQDLRKEGVLGNHNWYEEYGYEDDFWETAPECAELRNEVQWKQDVYGDLGYIERCTWMVTWSCLALNHFACDFGMSLDGGLVYWCIGGFSPKN